MILFYYSKKGLEKFSQQTAKFTAPELNCNTSRKALIVIILQNF